MPEIPIDIPDYILDAMTAMGYELITEDFGDTPTIKYQRKYENSNRETYLIELTYTPVILYVKIKNSEIPESYREFDVEWKILNFNDIEMRILDVTEP